MAINGFNTGTDDQKMDQHSKKLLDSNKKDLGGEGHPVQDISHENPNAGKSPVGFMKGELMNFTQMLEAMDGVQASLEEESNDILNGEIESSPPDDVDDLPAPTPNMGMGGNNDGELLDTLNQIFTPILIMQGIEGDISDQVQEAYSEENILTERTIIKFDNQARMAQLRKVCALLVARQKNSQNWQLYVKAQQIVKKTGLDIQKEEYAEADTLAQKYLLKVSTTNNSSVARKAAQDLLPETQH